MSRMSDSPFASSDDLASARNALQACDAVIEMMTQYVDDILVRARDVNGRRVTGNSSGPFALYVENRLDDLIKRVAALAATDAGEGT